IKDKEFQNIIKKAIEIKKNQKKYSQSLKQKTLIMLFQKTSTRTRLSFEAGMTQLGGHAIFMDYRTTQIKISDFFDEIRAIMKFGDVLMFRTLKHQNLVDAASVNAIPVVNALCEKYHPCQASADVMTMVEKCGGLNKIKGKRVVYFGIANNVSNSLIMACTKLGMSVTLCVPEKNPASHDPELEKIAKKSGLYEETNDVSCVKDADFAYTDTWIDMEFFDMMGNVVSEYKKEYERRKKALMPFQLNKKLLDKYKSKAKIMHDMPIHPDYEISRDAIDHKNSIIFDQAENRLHAQKAIMLWLMGKI
ncbi:ornithine carbamoyltransferase, partial [Candidatus Aenigmatarchaeota archaeon]